MQKTIQPKIPFDLPDVTSPAGAAKPVYDTTFKNAVVSNFNEGQPLPGVIFTCEHSSNALPMEYNWSVSDKKNFSNTHWALDIGALQMVLGLAQDLRTAVCFAKYSRLLLDTNRTPGMSTMFRKSGDGKIIDLNKGTGYNGGLHIDERNNRLKDYWYGYWSAVKKLLKIWNKDNSDPKNRVDPFKRYVFSIHSFTPVYEGAIREVQVGILCTHCTSLAQFFYQGFTKAGYVTRINEPYNSCDGPNQAGTGGNPQGETAFSTFFKGYGKLGKEGTICDGVRNLEFEFRNDLLTDKKHHANLRKVFVKLVEKLYKYGNPEFNPVERPICANPEPIQVEYQNAVIMNWGNHKREVQGQTRVCFSVENCSVNPTDEMVDDKKSGIPAEFDMLMKKGLLGSPQVQRLAISLAQEFNTILLSTKYARIICDVTKPVTSKNIIPEKIEFFENGKLTYQTISFNNKLSEKDEDSRIQNYYLGYYNGFQYIRNELGMKPNYWLSLRFYTSSHIHPALLKVLKIDTLPDIILNTQFFPEVAARLAHALRYPENIESSLTVDVNGLINPKMMFDYASHSLFSSKAGRKSVGILLYINQETIVKQPARVFEGLKIAIEKVCFDMHDTAEIFRFLG